LADKSLAKLLCQVQLVCPNSLFLDSEFWVEGTTINQEGEPGTLLAGSMGTSRAFARFTAKGALLNDASADGGHL